MTPAAIETMRQCLKAVIQDYPGFLAVEVKSSIDQLCDQALKAVEPDGLWLEGATTMFLDIQKTYPLTAPARTYAEQLLGRIRGKRT